MAEVTNYIDCLVAELCPDGVEYRPLGEIADIGTGKSDKKDAQEAGQYPFYVRSKTILRSSKYLFDETAIVIPGEGGVGEIFHFVSGKYDLHQRAYRISFVDKEMNPKFAYYYISSFFKEYINRHAVEATVKSIRKPMLVKFEVPVPPMEIQEAIVEILDKFTNLEAELEARTLQYEYYRDSLLASFSEPTVKFYPIEELFTTRNGYTPSKSNSSYWENGTVPWFRMEDIRENGGILSESLQSVHESALKKGGMFPAGSIIVATSATIGEHALINVDFLCNQRFTVLTPKEEFKSLLLPKFLYYYSFVLDRWCLSNTTQSSFASVDMKRFKKFEFPVPSLEEQQRIVDILDRFDSLTTSLSEGLPAELAARRSQYEYYRDQLLTFPRKGGN